MEREARFATVWGKRAAVRASLDQAASSPTQHLTRRSAPGRRGKSRVLTPSLHPLPLQALVIKHGVVGIGPYMRAYERQEYFAGFKDPPPGVMPQARMLC